MALYCLQQSGKGLTFILRVIRERMRISVLELVFVCMMTGGGGAGGTGGRGGDYNYVAGGGGKIGYQKTVWRDQNFYYGLSGGPCVCHRWLWDI